MRGGEVITKDKNEKYTDIIFKPPPPPPKKNFWGKKIGGEITEDQKKTLISEVETYTTDKKYVKIEIYNNITTSIFPMPQNLDLVPDRQEGLRLRDKPAYLFNYMNANYFWRFYTKTDDQMGYWT
jgi:hypothetical protein